MLRDNSLRGFSLASRCGRSAGHPPASTAAAQGGVLQRKVRSRSTRHQRSFRGSICCSTASSSKPGPRSPSCSAASSPGASKRRVTTLASRASGGARVRVGPDLTLHQPTSNHPMSHRTVLSSIASGVLVLAMAVSVEEHRLTAAHAQAQADAAARIAAALDDPLRAALLSIDGERDSLRAARLATFDIRRLPYTIEASVVEYGVRPALITASAPSWARFVSATSIKLRTDSPARYSRRAPIPIHSSNTSRERPDPRQGRVTGRNRKAPTIYEHCRCCRDAETPGNRPAGLDPRNRVGPSVTTREFV